MRIAVPNRPITAAFGEACYYGGNLIFSIYASRAYGMSAFGQFTLISSIIILLFSASNLSLSNLLRRDLTQSNNYEEIMGSNFIIRIAAGIGILCTTLFYLKYYTKVPLEYVYYALIIFLARLIDSINDIDQSLLICVNRYKSFFYSKFLFFLACALSCAILQTNNLPETEFYFIQIIPPLFSLLYLKFSQKRQSYFIRAKFLYIKQTLISSIPLILHGAVFAFYARYWVIFSEKISTNEVVGVFSFCVTIVGAFSLIPSAYGTSIYPSLCAVHSNKSQLKFYILKYLKIFLIFGIICTFVAMLFSNQLINFFKAQTDFTKIFFLITATSIFPNFINGIVGNFTTIVNKKNHGLLICIFMTVMSLFSYYYFFEKYEIIGLAISYSFLQYTYCFLLLLYFFVYIKD